MNRYTVVLCLAFAAALSACGARNVPLQDLGPDALFQRGVQQLEDRRWDDALRSLGQFVSQHPGDRRTEEARFLQAEAYFGKKEYVTAASEYVRLANDYSGGEFADDARFRACEAYVSLSPKPQLDQSYTFAAIEHCESLIAWYPTSEFSPRARQIVEEMRDKLAQKAYLSGTYYQKQRAYDSSIIYFDTVVREYPGTAFAPRALLQLVEVYRSLGYTEEMETSRTRLLRDYPSSPEAAQARAVTLPG